MGSTFFGLNIGKSGLYAYQAALDTTAHNITNAETDGYSKQVVGQQAGKALQVNSTYGMAGTGVDITGVTQLRDSYYDEKYWTSNTTLGEYDTKSHYMTEIENYFNEENDDGFTKTYSTLYDSLQELQKNPSSLTVRTQVTNYAESLGEYFNGISNSLQSIQEELNFEVKNQVDKVNSTAQQIASLTKQINTIEVNGMKANDLRDQRNLLIDNLSKIANVSVSEKVVGEEGVGVTSYVVKIDNQTLVDGISSYKLKVVPRESKNNMNDIDGLYDIAWESGQNFNLASSTLGGTLKALYEMRDGNNLSNLQGTASAEIGDTSIEMTDTNINSAEKLNIPREGVITIGNQTYAYTGFEVKKDTATNKLKYTFELKDPVSAEAVDMKASIGDSINYKGIPYYMNQMNELVRTYAENFNNIHRQGTTLNGKCGEDFFTATDQVSGRQYTFGPLEDSDDKYYYDYNTFTSDTGGYYEDVSDSQPLYGSYYYMTAANFKVNSDIISDPKNMATGTNITDGTENNDIVDKLLAMKTDKSIFTQGTAEGFFQSTVAEIGIDSKKASSFTTNQENIRSAIDNQRQSVSGVDKEEEAMNLIKFKNAYNLSAKVISVMNQVYDKLINYMGV